MKKKYMKTLRMTELLKYLLKKAKWIIAVGLVLLILTSMVAIIKTKRSEKQQVKSSVGESQYQLIDGNYVCSSMFTIVQKQGGKTISTGTMVSVLISNAVIQPVIDEMNLSDNYIDISHKLSWVVNGESIKLSISSPLEKIDGYTWDQVLEKIIEQGENVIEKNYEITDFRIIDKPYYENAKLKENTNSSVVQATVNYFSIRTEAKVVIITMILMTAFFSLIYVFDDKIMCIEDIEENLDIPVLFTYSKGDAK